MPSVTATAIVGAGALGAGASIYGANSAAGAESNAANQANATQLAMFNQIQGLESPYVQSGYGATNTLNYLLGLPTVSTGNGTMSVGAGTTGGALTADQANALLAARPDVMQAYETAKATADPNSPAYAQKGLTSPQAYANWWYNTQGGSTQYQIPGTTQAGQTPANVAALNAAGLTQGSLLTAPKVDLTQDPSYQFQLGQGLNAIQNAASVYGGGGNAMKALNDYAQNFASQDYWNIYNADVNQRNSLVNLLTGMAGSGQNAAANLATTGYNTAGTIGQNTIGAGNASAAGTIGTTNAITGSLNNGLQNYLMYNMMNNGNVYPGPGYTPATTADVMTVT